MNTHSLPPTRSTRDNEALRVIADRLAAGFTRLDLFRRLAEARSEIPGRVVFTTSFGLEDQAIGHAIFTQALPIEVVTLDTGRLFPETYEVWTETEERYGRRIRALFPERRAVEAWVTQHGIDGFRSSIEARQGCCAVRKVEPIGRALAGAAGWITGVRAEQSGERAATPYAAVDSIRGLVKLTPLLDWTRDRVVDFVRDHGIPYNPLHDRGFLSIGCAPCTRAVAPGEPERAGRWWWEQEGRKECGLHSRPAARRAPAEAAVSE
jgi:phosphoadenosine phosphosulfate reductase